LSGAIVVKVGFAESKLRSLCWQGFDIMAVAPGLRAGRGLEQKLFVSLLGALNVAPGLRAGRGLELHELEDLYAVRNVAPGLRAGRGLEL
jgi:hypothetical protein